MRRPRPARHPTCPICFPARAPPEKTCPRAAYPEHRPSLHAPQPASARHQSARPSTRVHRQKPRSHGASRSGRTPRTSAQPLTPRAPSDPPISMQTSPLFGRHAQRSRRFHRISPDQRRRTTSAPHPIDRNHSVLRRTNILSCQPSPEAHTRGRKIFKIVLAQTLVGAYNGRAAKARGVSSVG